MLLFSCHICPSYQWFDDNKLGIRICKVEFSPFMYFKGTIQNKSDKPKNLSGFVSDVNLNSYTIYNQKIFDNLIKYKQAYWMTLYPDFEIPSNSEINFYLLPDGNSQIKNNKVRYEALKKRTKNGFIPFNLYLKTNNKNEDELIEINFLP